MARHFDLFTPREDSEALNQLMADANCPLLTFEQEVALARRVRGENVYVPAPGAARPTPAESKSRLITSNVRLVVNVAKRYASHGVPIEDLVQEGILGLKRASEKYDPNRGWRFSTYATWWVRQAMGRTLQSQSRTIRIPTHVGNRVRKVVEAERQLTLRLEGEPSLEAIAEMAEISLDDVKAIMRIVSSQPTSLDLYSAGDSDDPVEVRSSYVQSSDDVEEAAVASDGARSVRYALSFLPARERIVLALRFGVLMDHAFSLHEVGQVIGVTRERARQIESEGMERIRSDKLLTEMFAASAA